jgi:hypothetical protein
VRSTGPKRPGNFTESGSRIKEVLEDILSDMQIHGLFTKAQMFKIFAADTILFSLRLRLRGNSLQLKPVLPWPVSDSRLCLAPEMTHGLKSVATLGRIVLYKTQRLALVGGNCSLCTDSRRATNHSWLRIEPSNRSSNNNHRFETRVPYQT